MEEERILKKNFTQELEGTRRRGIPRKGWKEEVERDLKVLGVRRWRELVIDRKEWKGWKEEVERDLQVLGVRRWRELVIDRKEWKDIVRQAKAHRGL